MLVDVIQVADRDHALGGDGLIVRLNPLRHTRLAELRRSFGTDADQFRQTLVRRRRFFGVGVEHRAEHVIDLLRQSIGQLGILNQLGR